MEEKKNKGLYIVIIMLTILLICSLGYIVYNEFIKENETVENKEEKEDNDLNSEENNDEEIISDDINVDELGKELLLKTAIYTHFQKEYILYSYQNLTYDTLNNSDKLKITYAQIPNNEKTYNPEDSKTDECYDNNDKYHCYYEKVSKQVFEDYYHMLFGSDKTIEYNEIVYAEKENLTCNLENAEFVCYPYRAGGALNTTHHLEYDYAQENGENIIIYVNFLAKDDGDNSVYCDAAMKNKIGESYSIDKDKLFEEFNEKTGIYKVTFKKDTNDNYYWYSSEIIK